MDWVIWTVAGIILIGIIVGVYRGALRIAVSIATTILTIVITVFLTPYVAGIVEDKTPLDESIRNSAISTMEDAAMAILGIDVSMTGIEDEEQMDVLAQTEIPRDVQIQAIESAELPEIFKNILMENNNDEIYTQYGVESFVQYVGVYLTKLLIHVATFLGVFLVVTIILRAIIFALNVVNDIPVFGIVNRLFGGVTGALCGCVIVWFIFSLITLFYSSDFVQQIYGTVQGNAFTKLLYDNNPLLNISVNF